MRSAGFVNSPQECLVFLWGEVVLNCLRSEGIIVRQYGTVYSRMSMLWISPSFNL